MDENQFYQTIGRLYAELLNSSQVIQNQNNIVSQLQNTISTLELEISTLQRKEDCCVQGQCEQEDKPPVNEAGYDPVPPRITTYEQQQ